MVDEREFEKRSKMKFQWQKVKKGKQDGKKWAEMAKKDKNTELINTTYKLKMTLKNVSGRGIYN